jgi:soluble lytic murein transglycosylase-like protein
MATIPTMTGPRVAAGGAGQVLAPPQPYQDAGIAGSPAAYGGAAAAGIQSLGSDLGVAGREFAAQALKEQALVNEAMARDADSAAAITMGNIYNEYATLEGEKAVAAKATFMQRMDEARKAAVATMPNPETKRMLDAVVTRRAGFYQESIGRYAASEQKKWQARSAQGAARVAQDQAAQFVNVPAVAEGLIESGVNSIAQLGEIHGWDADTLTAETAKYRGDAYGKLVTQLLAAGKVDEAAKLFEGAKNRLDAQSQAQIAQALKPHQQKQETQMDFAAVGGTGGGTFTNIADAIMMQESGGRDGLVSVDGARGRMQIMPATFQQWAQPGESIDVPADNRRVGERMIAAYQEQYAGDPERVAVAYFSGPGNVSEPGAPHPWKEDKKDGNGKSVSSYVKDITARLRKDTTGVPTYERPDFGAMRERALSSWGDGPERLTRVLSRIGQAETQYNSTTKADRDTLAARLNDVQGALSDGRAVAIPEVEIRRLYPKEQADEILGRLGEAQQLGYAMQAVALASPQEFAALLANYDDVGRTGEQGDEAVRPGYAQRAKVRETLIRAWQQRAEQIKADPAAYAQRAPAVAAAVESGDAEAYARASLGEQERLGVAEADRRVLPKNVTAGLVQKVVEADPEKVPAALVLGEVGKQYGAMWPAVFRDMVRGGLPAEYAILGSMSHPDQVGARGDAQRMLAFAATKGGEKALREAVGDTMTAKSIDDGVDAKLSDFYETARFATGGAGLRANMREFVRNMAYYYAGQGATASQALDRAVSGALKAKYDFDGTMRVPKGKMDLAREVTRGVQAALSEADLAPLADGPIAAEQRGNLVGVAKNGFWVPNADDTGLVLMGTYKVAETGIPAYLPVKRAGGGNVEVKFDEMDAMRNTQRGSGTPGAGRREDAAPLRLPGQNEERMRRGLAPQ